LPEKDCQPSAWHQDRWLLLKAGIKRIFFLEKSDVFDFSFLKGDNLFYSRRIGLYEGNAVRIYGGARLTGRIGKWDLGFFDMQTAKFEDNPAENS